MVACICGGIGEIVLALAGTVGVSCGFTTVYNRRARLAARLARFAAVETRPAVAVELDPRDVGFSRKPVETVRDLDLARWIDSNTTDPRDFAA